jgi:hypothetical protein
VLKMNSVLQEINLSENNFGYNGFKLIAEVLKINSVLKEINLGGNRIVNDASRRSLRPLILIPFCK